MEIIGDFTTTLTDVFDEIDPCWRTYDGLVVAGTHAPRDIEHTLSQIDKAHNDCVPFLGICHGHQVFHIWLARRVLGIQDATSEEYGTPGTFVVKRRGEGMVCGEVGGESYWTQYDVDPTYFVGVTLPFGMSSVPFHPEYTSRLSKKHPLLVNFLELCQ